MIPQHIALKFDLANPANLVLTDLIPLFHRWIQTDALPDLLLDVVDYKHVPAGPGIMLIAHEGDYNLDLSQGRPGWRHRRRRGWTTDTLSGRLAETFDRALLSAQLLTTAALPAGPLALATGRITLTFLDQLNTPNDAATSAAFTPLLAGWLRDLYQTDAIDVNVNTNHASPLSFHITIADNPDPATLAQRLQAPVGGRP